MKPAHPGLLKKSPGPGLPLSLPVACSLDIFGDRRTLLVIRDLLLGRSRFRDFLSSPEGIPTNILADRLERLLEEGVIKHIPAADGTKRRAYQLTKKGEALRPVLIAMRLGSGLL